MFWKFSPDVSLIVILKREGLCYCAGPYSVGRVKECTAALNCANELNE